MTFIKDTFGQDLFKDLMRSHVGIDEHIRRLQAHSIHANSKTPNYPPYNIKKTADDSYLVELAIAGFSKEDIDIEVIDGTLKVTGTKQEEPNDLEFLFRGISNRSFVRHFLLGEYVQVQSADIENGMLKITFKRIIPEHKKPQKIEIGNTTAKTFLTE